MKNLKNIFTAAVIATATLCAVDAVAPKKADAQTSYCYQTDTGADVCILRVVQDGPYHKIIKSAVDGYVTTDRVYCNPAHRYNYRENMYGIACFQFN